ncbi:xylulokinase [Aristaeella hokkaidonensis]|uniref:Xylulokinase n=1 Tax=Aristaeella hokkaidonensis TaxID=3046382 RepID=A0AC61MUW2_9FIRM|nr:xylulokinase [Aristaeella hokkaidonensis]QUC65947.1 xylulokinase [Aristaeella hokkaidonensis]SNT93833.1 xylulokinase [Aristaeella hokkaidonensis]
MRTLLLGVDIGTSSCKTALFDPEGKVVAQGGCEYPVSYPRKGWAEQDPAQWWEGVCRAVREMISDNGIDPAEIAGIGTDGQSWSAIALDREGNVLCPTPIWTDTRSEEICRETEDRLTAEKLFDLCGNPAKPGYTWPKILWYRKHRPEVFEKTEKILQSNSYIVYRMTGEITQDISQGYGLACFDMRKGCWDEEMCEALGIPRRMLPEIVPCHQIVGKLTVDAAKQMGLREGIPVAAGGLDAACGTLGAGVVSPGQTQEQGGQAGGMSICIDQYAADPRLILGFHVVPGRWLLQGGTTGGGGALKWLRETMCPELSFAEMSALAETAEPGSGGVTFLPYMAGERSPIWDPKACGVFFGLNFGVTRAQMIRACMEGVAYSLRHNLETAAEAGARAGVLRAMGGSANSRIWTQIKADVTGCGIEVPGSDTATTLGAAMLAGVGTGVWQGFEEAARQTIRVNRTYEPDPAVKEIYDWGYETYRKLYGNLKDLMNA